MPFLLALAARVAEPFFGGGCKGFVLLRQYSTAGAALAIVRSKLWWLLRSRSVGQRSVGQRPEVRGQRASEQW